MAEWRGTEAMRRGTKAKRRGSKAKRRGAKAKRRGTKAKRRGTKARQKRALNLERQMKVRVLKYLIPRTEKKITEVELTKTKLGREEASTGSARFQALGLCV